MTREPMTIQGEIRLREELQDLKKNQRPRIIREIAEARAHGDLSENAEYHAAREEQSLTEARIALLEEKLSSAQVIDTSSLDADGKIVFGATVELMNLATEEEVSYQIVGGMEADIKSRLVSVTSPLARALIGREEGDVVTVQAPSGAVEYEILTVQYS
uniref:Transcription elongation factor GreA n=2 Tax=unclassified Candidatus Kentrum TaxID=2643149 RepID=A0A451AXT5_9GAMM|nr:MAG: transcription elongation factor GreA [Candidatus Kentron sp. LPFa]VFK63066.1 MAG: transcription elongation factor GreA [Candidatus Kentron sp. UNK]VFK70707.1 MAG: transcription elongation factor GreA [Candidatus Kentron sp. UNK]